MNPARLLQGRSAHAIAFLALILALGGSAYAIKKDSVSSKAIKNGTIKEKDVKPDALTGASIAEATLGKVPAAANADGATNATNAANAANAAAVDGQSIAKVQYNVPDGGGATTLFDGGGLKISAVCGAPLAQVALTATTTKAGSSIYSLVGGDATPSPDDPFENDLEDGEFDVGDNFDLLAGGGGNINVVDFAYQAPDGTVATGLLAVDEFSSDGCTVAGHVTFG